MKLGNVSIGTARGWLHRLVRRLAPYAPAGNDPRPNDLCQHLCNTRSIRSLETLVLFHQGRARLPRTFRTTLGLYRVECTFPSGDDLLSAATRVLQRKRDMRHHLHRSQLGQPSILELLDTIKRRVAPQGGPTPAGKMLETRNTSSSPNELKLSRA